VNALMRWFSPAILKVPLRYGMRRQRILSRRGDVSPPALRFGLSQAISRRRDLRRKKVRDFWKLDYRESLTSCLLCGN